MKAKTLYASGYASLSEALSELDEGIMNHVSNGWQLQGGVTTTISSRGRYSAAVLVVKELPNTTPKL